MSNDIKFYMAVATTSGAAFIIYQYATLLHYAFIGSVVIGGIMVIAFALTTVSNMMLGTATKYQEMKLIKADVAYRESEARVIEQVVTVVKPGHGIAITNVNHPMMITSHAMPIADKVATVAQLPAPVDEWEGIKTGEGWIDETLFNEQGKIKTSAFVVNGATGGGKTYFILHLMSLVQRPHPKAEYWLLDPKFEGEESGWPFDPFVTDFNEMAAGAEYLYSEVVVKRKHAKREGIQPKCPAFFVFDEFDGCAAEHKAKFTDPLKRIIKEERSSWCYSFMAGQSSLVNGTGLDGSIYRNATRFIIGNEALAFINNSQFTIYGKPHRATLANQLRHLQESGKRSALVIPSSMNGLPFVAEIPNLPKPSFSQAAKVDEAYSNVKRSIFDATVAVAEPNEQERKVLDMLANGVDITEIGRVVFGGGTKGGTQNQSVKAVASKFNVEI